MTGERTRANEAFFAREADRIAELSLRLAERFLAGGRLLATGAGAQDASDQRHVAVEFVHPVIVGKRALPALAVDAGRLGLLASPADAVISFGPPVRVPAGCLSIAFAAGAPGWTFEPPTEDAFVAQELVETLYHVLWETVHVFLDHQDASTAGAGASSFLYPFLERAPVGIDELLDDVSRSVRAKAREVGELRGRTVADGTAIAAAAAAVAGRAAGAKVLAFGNGGSATDAMDLVADLADLGVPSVDLTADAAILTALANDVGPEVLFQRQVIAYGREGDIAVAFSTSGGSANVIAALAEARRRGLVTVAFVGYDGGRILDERLADHVVVAPSEYVPRIQEAQATAYHLVCDSIRSGVHAAEVVHA